MKGSNMDRETKDNAIKKEKAKLQKIFKDLPADVKSVTEGLIQNAAFMYVTLLELQEEIKDKGAIMECKSGNGFDTIKDNPAQKAYTTMISRYTVIIKQLTDLLPNPNETTTGAELLNFISND